MNPRTQSTKPITALIVDDEERAQDLLTRLLSRIPGVEICGKAFNTDEALELIIANDPDLVFLDVEMPGKSGLHLVDYLKKYRLNTTVIFVTAHAEFAIDALRASAFDYLLKPVMMSQLTETILRYKAEKARPSQEKSAESLSVTAVKPCKIKFNTRTGYILVSPQEIIYCDADVNYTGFYFGNNNREVVTVNLGRIEEMLAPYSFYRISRSILINTAFLKKADRQRKKCLLEKAGEAVFLDISPNHIRELEKMIDNSAGSTP
ncbi:MAG: response regulator transcription factor [Bacteroidales bacterium]|nr:response regulator transcription factor [Bacteroidales bacterium]